ncbi:hypothetical protein [Ornithinimicrobium kibberense]|uniref:VCBS repeat protein n=1 Tax=Ornithinimicrobium kibberense TaxID=282060 RepID=A0ABV5V2F5_9MICO
MLAAAAVGVALALPVHAVSAPAPVAASVTDVRGTVTDPRGQVWVADSKAGFCRLTATTSGTIEEMTCLGGADAGSSVGLPGVPAGFDTDPESPGLEVVLIPDRSAPLIVRARWDAAAGSYRPAGDLTVLDDLVRPSAVVAAADGGAYVVMENARTVLRIDDPGAEQPHVRTVGFTTSPGARSVAFAEEPTEAGRLYLAESDGVTVLDLPPQGRRGTEETGPAVEVSDSSALLLSDVTGELLVGTSGRGPGRDVVERVDLGSGAVDREWLTGQTNVSGLGWFDSKVLVASDSDPATPGSGAIHAVPLGLKIVGGPTLADGSVAPDPGWTNDPTPTFTIRTDGLAVECAVSGAGEEPVWVECGGESFTSAALVDGSYDFALRQVDGSETVRVAFAVDTTPPAPPRITSPAPGGSVPERVVLDAQVEDGTTTEYAVDGEFAPTSLPVTLRLPPGEQTVRVRSVDRAKNTSPPAQVTFMVSGTRARLDFNGDGVADVMGRDSVGRLWLYPGDGGGGWLGRVQVGSGWNGFTTLLP